MILTKRRRKRQTERATKATIATASVKAQAEMLVHELRENLDKLEKVLKEDLVVEETEESG